MYNHSRVESNSADLIALSEAPRKPPRACWVFGPTSDQTLVALKGDKVFSPSGATAHFALQSR